MNLSDYQRAAERTMTDTDNERRILNAALGLCGEAAELSEVVESMWGDDAKADVLNETGDLFWYVAQMCKSIGKSIASVPPLDYPGLDKEHALLILWRNTGGLADVVKKSVFHRKPMNPIAVMTMLQAVMTAGAHLLAESGYTVEAACNINNTKLLKRFPNGYNHADANARADEVAK
jgi:NTP pyrophosphatase (non-canonical NTP hydrolase)